MIHNFFESLPKCYFRRCYFWTTQKRAAATVFVQVFVVKSIGHKQHRIKATFWPSHAFMTTHFCVFVNICSIQKSQSWCMIFRTSPFLAPKLNRIAQETTFHLVISVGAIFGQLKSTNTIQVFVANSFWMDKISWICTYVQ